MLIMRKIDIRKYSSALLKWLRNTYWNNELKLSFRKSDIYQQGITDIADKMKTQEKLFKCFIESKQKEIDDMPDTVLKTKMQNHLNDGAFKTYKHFNKMNKLYCEQQSK